MQIGAIAIIALGLSPGTWLRDAPAKGVDSPVIVFRLIALDERVLGSFTVEGAWHLDSSNFWFGGIRRSLRSTARRCWPGQIADGPCASRFRLQIVCRSRRRGSLLSARNTRESTCPRPEALTDYPVTGGIWVLAKLEPPLPTDNYEGIAVAPDESGKGAAVWVMLDDNRMRKFQRKLRWSPSEQ